MKRLATAIGVMALGGTLALGGPAGLALAQAPAPNVTALDYRPSNLGGTATGIVVEGVGSGACAFTLASIKSATVHYIRKHKPTWTELSPQRGCATLARYKQMIHGIITYVRARVPGLAATWWAGFMLDEEPNFGFTAAQAISLNKYALSQTNKLSGRTTVFTEDATWVGGWTQSQYKKIIGSTVDASQIYNSHMVTVVNHLGQATTMVTWTRTMPAPFNTRGGASGKIKGKPYSNPFGTGKTRNWSNRWRSQ
jgi:hypothetical protein